MSEKNTLILSAYQKINFSREAEETVEEIVEKVKTQYSIDEKIVCINKGEILAGQQKLNQSDTLILVPSSLFKSGAIAITIVYNDIHYDYILKFNQILRKILRDFVVSINVSKEFLKFTSNDEQITFFMYFAIELKDPTIYAVKVDFNTAIDNLFFKSMSSKKKTPIKRLKCYNSLLAYAQNCKVLEIIINQLSELTCDQFTKLEPYKEILKLKTLQDNDEAFSDIELIYKECLFNCIFRPLNMFKIREISPIKNFKKFDKKTLKYIWYSLAVFVSNFKEDIGTVGPCKPSKEVMKLVKSILLSKPSLEIMVMVHELKKKNIKLKVKELINQWKSGQNIYVVYNHDRNDRLFWALSEFSGHIFLHSSLLDEDIFSQAYAICHEFQHVIERPQKLVYSPIKYLSNPILAKYFIDHNHGIPLESGHLYFSLLIGKVGVKIIDLKIILGDNCSNPEFWKRLSKEFPILKSDVFYQTICDRFSDLPYSFHISEFSLRD